MTHATAQVAKKSNHHSIDHDVVNRAVSILERLEPSQARMLLSCMERISESLRKHDTCSKTDMPLSQREQEVLLLISHGYTRRDIASCLEISAHTAASHISNIYSKLNISSVAQATAYALQHELVVKCHTERSTPETHAL